MVMCGLLTRLSLHQLQGTAPTMLELLEHSVRLLVLRFSQHPRGEVAHQPRLSANGDDLRGSYALAAIKC